MNRRLRKKLHKKYLDYIIDLSHVGNASNSRHWRTRLMAGNFSDPQLIDKNTLGSALETGLDIFTIRAVMQYNLAFQVTKLPCCEDGVEFPEINTYSINNTET